MKTKTYIENGITVEVLPTIFPKKEIYKQRVKSAVNKSSDTILDRELLTVERIIRKIKLWKSDKGGAATLEDLPSRFYNEVENSYILFNSAPKVFNPERVHLGGGLIITDIYFTGKDSLHIEFSLFNSELDDYKDVKHKNKKTLDITVSKFLKIEEE